MANLIYDYTAQNDSSFNAYTNGILERPNAVIVETDLLKILG